MTNGLGIELEEGGLVALIAVFFFYPARSGLPKSKDSKSVAIRSAVVAGLIAGALAIEAAMEQTAGEIKQVVT